MIGFSFPFLVLVFSIGFPRFIASFSLGSLDGVCTPNSSSTLTFNGIGPRSFGSVILSSNTTSGYKSGMNCTINLKAPQHYQVHLAFSEISTRDNDYLMVTTNVGQSIHILRGNWSCPNESNCPNQPVMMFDATEITLQFVSDNSRSTNDTLKGFIGMATVFSIADNHGNCHIHEQFRCNNRHCIWKGLFCNQHNHCGDNSDEPPHCEPFEEQYVWGVLVILFGAISFCIFLPLFCIFAYRGQRRIRTTRAMYQPLPTSINDRETTHYTPVLMAIPATYYGTGLLASGSDNSVEVHHSKVPANDNNYQTYH